MEEVGGSKNRVAQVKNTLMTILKAFEPLTVCDHLLLQTLVAAVVISMLSAVHILLAPAVTAYPLLLL